MKTFEGDTASADFLCRQRSHVTDSEHIMGAFHIPTVCILLFGTTCLFRMINNQATRHQQMNTDEVRVNNCDDMESGTVKTVFIHCSAGSLNSPDVGKYLMFFPFCYTFTLTLLHLAIHYCLLLFTVYLTFD